MSRVWVLVYCLRVKTWFGLYMFICLWNSMYLYDKMSYTLAYPFCLFGCFVCGSSLLRWSSICWCEQMREVLEVNKEGMISLHSLPRLDFFYLSFSLWLWPMYCFGFWCIINYCYVPVLIFVFGIVVCLVPLLYPFEQLHGVRFIF